MARCHGKVTAHIACMALFAGIAALIPTAAAGQGPPTDRERNVSEIERSKNGVAGHDAGAKQFTDDFMSIQTVGADMMKVFSSAKPTDYKHISDDAAEIRKRAIRLRDYLVLPPAKREKAKNGPDPEQLESSLPVLRDLIQDFVKSPIFQTQEQRADYREIAKARRELDDIIDLSAAVRKTADKKSAESPK
jgi:hypothetical protein